MTLMDLKEVPRQSRLEKVIQREKVGEVGSGLQQLTMRGLEDRRGDGER